MPSKAAASWMNREWRSGFGSSCVWDMRREFAKVVPSSAVSLRTRDRRFCWSIRDFERRLGQRCDSDSGKVLPRGSSVPDLGVRLQAEALTFEVKAFA